MQMKLRPYYGILRCESSCWHTDQLSLLHTTNETSTPRKGIISHVHPTLCTCSYGNPRLPLKANQLVVVPVLFIETHRLRRNKVDLH